MLNLLRCVRLKILKQQSITSSFQKLQINFPNEYRAFFKKLRHAFNSKTNFLIIWTLNISNSFIGPLEDQDIESQLYSFPCC